MRDAAVERVEGEVERVTPLHVRAADNLAFIRETMHRSTSFTAVPGKGMVVVGLIGLAGAFAAAEGFLLLHWIDTWILTGVTACSFGMSAMAVKARRMGTSLIAGPGWRFLLGFSPAITVGAALSIALYYSGETYALSGALLPGIWLTLYGVAVIGGGMFSISLIPLMGACFISLGFVALLVPLPEGIVAGTFTAYDVLLAIGFGGLHIAFGSIIAWKHGG